MTLCVVLDKLTQLTLMKEFTRACHNIMMGPLQSHVNIAVLYFGPDKYIHKEVRIEQVGKLKRMRIESEREKEVEIARTIDR